MAAKIYKIIFFFLAALISAVSAFLDERQLPEPAWWFWLSSIMMLTVIFCWYRNDAIERQVDRPAWLNIGIVALSLVFVPVYLLRRAGRGNWLRASASMGAYLLGILAVGTIAALLGGAVA